MPLWIKDVISLRFQWTDDDLQELKTYAKYFFCIMGIETLQILYSKWIYFVIFSILGL